MTALRFQKWPWRLIFWVSLMVWVAIAMVSSLRKSVVIDEVPHIAAGLTYWKYGDFRLNPEHPVLVKLLSVVPVLLLDNVPIVFETEDFYVKSWFRSDQFRFGYYLLFRNAFDPRDVVFHARLVPICIGVLGGLLAFWCGRRLGGGAMGGALAGLLLLLYPEYMGHARFVTFDVPTLVGCAFVSLAALKWWRHPCGRTVALFVVAACIGSLVKLPVTVFTVFQLLTLLGLCVLPGKRLRVRHWLVLVLFTVAAGYLVAWGSAGFRFQHTNPAINFERTSDYVHTDGDYGEGVDGKVLHYAWKHRILPETSLAVLKHASSFKNRNYFFMGQWNHEGWYGYFFVTFLLKTSLVMVVVYLLVAITWGWNLKQLRGRKRAFWLQQLSLFLIPFAALFVVFVAGRASLGHRYILFVYFPLSVLTGVAMARWWIGNFYGRLFTVVVGVASVVVFALQYPNYETYFNEIMRTPYRAMSYLGDSNVDWGQDMPAVRDELSRLNIRNVNLAIFGASRPSAYGISGYNFILANYPFAIFRDGLQDRPLDKNLYTVVSLNGLSAARFYYKELARDPDWVYNSVAIYKPESAAEY